MVILLIEYNAKQILTAVLNCFSYCKLQECVEKSCPNAVRQNGMVQFCITCHCGRSKSTY